MICPGDRTGTGLYCWAATDIGQVRSCNEDAFATSGSCSVENRATWQGPLGQSGWAVVADGMGGHAAGEVASRLAVECIGSVLTAETSEPVLTAIIEETNNALFSAMSKKPELAGMGTTVVGVVVTAQIRATFFNAGDSRIYLLTESALTQLSVDDVVHGHQLTKCLGGSSRTLVRPHISIKDVTAGSLLLLCTDGLTNELPDSKIEQLLRSDEPADALVQSAVAAGGRDNVTAVVISTGHK